ILCVLSLDAAGQDSIDPSTYAPENTAEACRDAVDNDQDGLIDCEDKNCHYLSFCKEKLEAQKGSEDNPDACRDGFDNDEDGFVDCDDKGCRQLTFCIEKGPENTSEACQDKLDNDGDGFVDCYDKDCSLYVFCAQQQPTAVPILPAGCARDFDCKGARVCIGGQCVEKTRLAPLKVSTGSGLFVPGVILSSLSILFYAVAVGVGVDKGFECDKLDEMEDNNAENYLTRSIATGGIGVLFSLVGGGLLVGGQARAVNSVKRHGLKTSTGLLAAGAVTYVLYGITTFATIGVGCTTGIEGSICPGWFSIPVLGVQVINFIINVAGWAIAAKNARRAYYDHQKSQSLLLPFVTPVRGGAVAGMATAF
ncbi:MAG: hypothetical protein ABIJ56_24395, partial [Pseudomonadota bacterium]